MDFKQYVKMILEADKKAEDTNKKSEEFDEDEDEASCKTHKSCTGCESEASVKDSNYEDEYDTGRDDGYNDGYEDGCEGKKKAPSKVNKSEAYNDGFKEGYEDGYEEGCKDDSKDYVKANSLKESMIYSSNYIGGNNYNTITEEKEIAMVLTESIKNNSASKFLEKQSKKALREAERLSSKGKREEAKLAKEAGKSLKEASAKLYKVESDYKAGDPAAKREYKKLCKEYSKVLKQKGKALKGIGKFTAALVGTAAGAALLGTIGLTTLANDDIIERLEDGIKNDKLGEVIKGMAIKDKDALFKLVDAAGEGIEKDAKYSPDWKEKGIFDNTKEAVKKAAEDIDRNAYKNDGYHDNRENFADNAGKMAKVFGIKNKEGKAFNYKDMFGKKK